MRFGLFFFAASAEGAESYDGLLSAVRQVDEALGFVSFPERHFSDFGGQFPNPALLGAATAAITKHVQIRAGSLVSPLHHVLRVVEDWSVVDRLSAGRVAISFGSGWHANDFVLMPGAYQHRRELMVEQIRTIQKLWLEGSGTFLNGLGQPVHISLKPRPIQHELPVWVTTSGNPATFALAGTLGANVLTHLENQDLQTLGDNIRAYRAQRALAGHNASAGLVTLMVHTFVNSSAPLVSNAIAALHHYILKSIDLETTSVLVSGEMSGGKKAPTSVFEHTALRDALALRATAKYSGDLGLIGSVDTCSTRAGAFAAVGVDELACLVDFVPTPLMLEGIPALLELVNRLSPTRAAERANSFLAEFMRPLK